MKENRTNRQWWQQAVVYQIYPRSFRDSNGDGIGDLKGITERLDYIQDLGVNTIWLCPIYKSPMVDNGYDIADYYEIDPTFGTMEDFDELLRESSKRGIRVVMDLVLNHCSDQHRWFQEARKDPEGPYARYFHIRKSVDGKAPNNWRSIFGGSTWTRIDDTDYYYLHVFAKEQPDLNWDCKELREEIYAMINWWLDKGVAGFRMDAITYIKKEDGMPSHEPDAQDGLVDVARVSANQPGIGAYLSEMRDRTYGRAALTVGETSGVSDEELADYISLENGYFSMIFDFSFCLINLNNDSDVWYDTREWTPDELKSIMFHRHEAVGEGGWLAPCMENHDQGREIDFYLPEEGRNYYGATMLATMHMMRRGTPFIYQGQELGMRNINMPSIEMYNDVQTIDQYKVALAAGLSEQEALESIWLQSRDNARYPFQWDGTDKAGFTDGTPWLPTNKAYAQYNVADESADPDSILAFWKALIALRLRSDYVDVLTDGDFVPYREEQENLVAYTRSLDGQTVLVLCNYSHVPMTVTLPGEVRETLLDNYRQNMTGSEAHLAPYEAAIVVM